MTNTARTARKQVNQVCDKTQTNAIDKDRTHSQKTSKTSLR